jgi:hypothetical protein
VPDDDEVKRSGSDPGLKGKAFGKKDAASLTADKKTGHKGFKKM